MANYTVFPSDDVRDTAGNAITGTSTKVNSGAGVALGSGASGLLDNIAPGARRGADDNFGSQLIQVANLTTTALSSGTFGYMVAGTYVIRRVSATLSGVANTALQSGGSDHSGRRSIHFIEQIRSVLVATAIRAGNWNIYSGTFSSGPTAQLDTFGSAGTADQGGVDDAARPSAAVPGELVYRDGSPNPIQDQYKAKTSW